MKVAEEQRDQFQQDMIDYLEANSATGEEWADYRTDTDSANDRKMEDARYTFSGIYTRRSRWQNPPDLRDRRHMKSGYPEDNCCP
jgi:hypothetical protein